MVKTLRLLGDVTRVRILNLLQREQLSVVELQEVLGMGQSRISSHLSQLKRAGLVSDTRSGKHSIYAFGPPADSGETVNESLLQTISLAAEELEESKDDLAALELALKKRRDRSRAYFDELAGKFGKTYVPGRSWKSLGESLLKLLPPLVIADLGAGEGTFSQLLAQRAEKVIAIDNSEKMVEFGTLTAKENGFTNLEYRVGDLENPPIEDQSVDMAFFSQALHHAEKPKRAIESAYRILKPGGKIVILDLLKHQFEDARELYADVWLGFSELEISRFLEQCGFADIEIDLVDKETEAPYFQTLLAIARKP